MLKVGITFGTYAPMHKGHLDLILRAKKENDLTFVFVCGYDDQPREFEIGLPLKKRFMIVRNFLEDDLVKVFMINDTELGIDESYSPHNWYVWTKEVYSKVLPFVKEECAEFTWYVGESSYSDSLNNYSYIFLSGSLTTRDEYEKIHFSRSYKQSVIVIDRSRNDISGTKCRRNPIKEWKNIALPFRPYLSHNILIAGTASEGKTTLVQDLGRYFGIPYSYEKGRDVCKWKKDDEFDFKDFMHNIYEQYKLNESLISSPQNPGVFVSDTDNMVTLMYAKAYAGRDGFAISEEEFDVLYATASEYAKTAKWNKIFLLAPHEKGIVDDGERYMPDSDYRIRLNFFNYLKSLYGCFGYSYEVLNGTYYENFMKVKEYIERLYE